jgi:hypothetical protein
MQIIQKNAPLGGEEIILEVISHAHAKKLGSKALHKTPLTDIQIGVPHQILELHLSRLAAEHKLSHAVPNGYRYFVRDKQGLIAVADVSLDYTGKINELLSFSWGDHIKRIVGALTRVEAHGNNNEYEMRLLRCSALNLNALLLTPINDDDSLKIFPIKPCPQYLTKSVYSEDEFFAALLPEAQHLLNIHLTTEPDKEILTS